ncbi:MAG: phosphopantothenoylcysteine decarboxylase [Candidatus Omnitrophota bacterium]
MSLKKRRILITAGPTWAAIDRIRVISNTATGETGFLLADKLATQGLNVTLVIGPAGGRIKSTKFKVIPFIFFNELKEIILRELKTGTYGVVVHSAAVSDYLPEKIFSGKVKSGLKNWKIAFKPAPKLIDAIKKIYPGVFLVGFKFEPGAEKSKLIKSARALMRRSNLDLAVANTAIGNKYRAYVLSGEKISSPLASKKHLVIKLAGEIKKAL